MEDMMAMSPGPGPQDPRFFREIDDKEIDMGTRYSEPPPWEASQPAPPQQQPSPRRRRRRWPWVILVLGVLFVVLVAIAAGSSTSSTVTSRGAQASPPASQAAPAPKQNAHFGESHTYSDGLVVTVAAPTPFQPSDTAMEYTPGGQAMALSITIINGSGQNYDPSMMMVSAQSGTTEEKEIFDSAKGMTGSPSTPVLPGRSLTYTTAFTATDMNDVVVQVLPGFQYDAGIFTQ